MREFLFSFLSITTGTLIGIISNTSPLTAIVEIEKSYNNKALVNLDGSSVILKTVGYVKPGLGLATIRKNRIIKFIPTL